MNDEAKVRYDIVIFNYDDDNYAQTIARGFLFDDAVKRIQAYNRYGNKGSCYAVGQSNKSTPLPVSVSRGHKSTAHKNWLLA